MREYECLYILDPSLEEEAVNSLSERFSQVLTDNAAEVLFSKPWGKRRLAYEINHVKEGYYVQMRFNAEAEIPFELDRELRLNESVMRHLIVRADELDPAATDQIPEVLPEPSFDSGDHRRGRYRDDRGPRPPREPEQREAAPESGEAAPQATQGAEEGEEPAAPAESQQAQTVSEESQELPAEAIPETRDYEARGEEPREPANEGPEPKQPAPAPREIEPEVLEEPAGDNAETAEGGEDKESES